MGRRLDPQLNPLSRGGGHRAGGCTARAQIQILERRLFLAAQPVTAPGAFPAERLLADLAPGTAPDGRPKGSDPHGYRAVGDTVVFLADADGSGGTELYRTDGTPEGTTLVKNVFGLPYGWVPDPFTEVHGLLCFASKAGEMWRTDGTAEGTFKVGNKFGYGAHRAGDWMFFYGSDAAHGAELWKTDGTAAGTALVKDITPGPAETLIRAGQAAVGNTLFFTAPDPENGYELWKSDGTEAGTQLVKVSWSLSKTRPAVTTRSSRPTASPRPAGRSTRPTAAPTPSTSRPGPSATARATRSPKGTSTRTRPTSRPRPAPEPTWRCRSKPPRPRRRSSRGRGAG